MSYLGLSFNDQYRLVLFLLSYGLVAIAMRTAVPIDLYCYADID